MMNQATNAKVTDVVWKGLYKIGGAATVTMLALIPIQIFTFVAYPPPGTAIEYFTLFQKNGFLGLLSLDLLYILNSLLLSIIYLALYLALNESANPSWQLP